MGDLIIKRELIAVGNHSVEIAAFNGAIIARGCAALVNVSEMLAQNTRLIASLVDIEVGGR